MDYVKRYSIPATEDTALNRVSAGNRLAKLHGSIDRGLIIPPTWSKGVNRDIVPAWRDAYRLLAEATQLRIIGYSLATADAYVKYLMKSAISKEPRLKKIDVLCRDRDGAVKARYADFINFVDYQFVNGEVDEYLRHHMKFYTEEGVRTFDKLELAHYSFMNKAKS